MGAGCSVPCSSKEKATTEYVMKHPRSRFSTEELEYINKTVGYEQKITREIVRKVWGSLLTPYLLDLYEKYIFDICAQERDYVDISTFATFYFDFVNGENNDRLTMFMNFFGNQERIGTVRLSDFQQYLENLIKSCFILMETKKVLHFQSWYSKGCAISQGSIDSWVKFLLNGLKDKPENEYITEHEIWNWMFQNPETLSLQCTLFTMLYGMGLCDNGFFVESSILPVVNLNNFRGDLFPFILDIPSVIFLNTHLPSEYRENWKLLFSMEINGESFSNFHASITNRGASILVIKDVFGHIFGGFASESWRVGPKFYGDARSFLFTLKPTMRIMKASYRNSNFQYLNTKQRTLPNGLAMGGQLGYVGLWLDSSFEYGCSGPSCVTYNDYERVAGAEIFQLNGIEVWGVENTTTVVEDREEKSILHRDATANALLDMLGKTVGGKHFMNSPAIPNQPPTP